MTVSLTATRFCFNLRQWGGHGRHKVRSATKEKVVVVVVVVVAVVAVVEVVKVVVVVVVVVE
jgi:hypothetical protein